MDTEQPFVAFTAKCCDLVLRGYSNAFVCKSKQNAGSFKVYNVHWHRVEGQIVRAAPEPVASVEAAMRCGVQLHTHRAVEMYDRLEPYIADW